MNKNELNNISFEEKFSHEASLRESVRKDYHSKLGREQRKHLNPGFRSLIEGFIDGKDVNQQDPFNNWTRPEKENFEIKTQPYIKDKNPKWLNDYLDSYEHRTGGKIESVEEIEFKNNFDIILTDLLPDIQKAMNKEAMMRFSLKPLREPNYISTHRIGSMDSEKEIQLGIKVREYNDRDIDVIPFSGFVVMGDFLIVAEETDDATAELTIKLIELILTNNLSCKLP
jgi:hypothetical protein